MGITVQTVQQNPFNDPAYMAGLIMAKAFANGQQQKELQDATKFLADQKNIATKGTVQDDDRTNALKQVLVQKGLDPNMVGQDATSLLTKNKQSWDELDAEKEGADKNTLNQITLQQGGLHKQNDFLRSLMAAKGVDVDGMGADNSASDTIAALAALKRPSAADSVAGVGYGGGLGSSLPASGTGQHAMGQSFGIVQQHPVSYALTLEDLLSGGMKNSQIDQLAAAKAAQRAMTSFSPTNFSDNTRMAMLEKGYSPDTINQLMPGAADWAKGVAAKQTQDQIGDLYTNMMVAMKQSDPDSAFAIAQKIDSLRGGGQMTDLLTKWMPEYKLDHNPMGGYDRTTMFNVKNGIGRSVDSPITQSSNNIADNTRALQTTAMNNDTDLKKTSMNNTTQYSIAQLKDHGDTLRKQMESGGGQAAFKAAKEAVDAYNSFEKNRMSKDQVNPFESAMKTAEQVLQGTMGAKQSDMSPTMQAFAASLQQEIQQKGPAAAREWVNNNRVALSARGINPDVALSWIPE